LPYSRGLTEKLIQDIKRRTKPAGIHEDRFEQYDEDRYTRYFFPIGQDDVLIRCIAPPPAGELRGCRMKFSSNDDIFLEVSFTAKNLLQHEAIRKSITELMSQFLVLDTAS
jgi:hypothetical protein